jgi:DNA-binding MarR family transcriptional regulator
VADDQTTQLVDQMMRFMRTSHCLKTAVMRDQDNPERAAYGLLFPLSKGHMRSGELAEAVRSDPSTVSRHIALLIDKRLVQRVPDQQDGRASLLALTDDGQKLFDELLQRRRQTVAAVLDKWSKKDIANLKTLLTRFNDDMENDLTHIIDGMKHAFETVANATPSTTDSTSKKELA